MEASRLVDRRRFDFRPRVAPNDPVSLQHSTRASVTPHSSMTRKRAQRPEQVASRTPSHITKSTPETPPPSAWLSQHTDLQSMAREVNSEPTVPRPHSRWVLLQFNDRPRTIGQLEQAVEADGSRCAPLDLRPFFSEARGNTGRRAYTRQRRQLASVLQRFRLRLYREHEMLDSIEHRIGRAQLTLPDY